MPRFLLLTLVVLLSACASLELELPAVSDNADGVQRPGKFVWHDLISDDPRASQDFFSALLGWDFQVLSLGAADYWLISHRGAPIGGMVNQNQLPTQEDVSQWVSVMALADVGAATDQVKAEGGRVIRSPVSLGPRGTMAVFADAQGALFAGLQSESGDPVDESALKPEGSFFWHELWTNDVGSAESFYIALTGLQGEPLTTVAADGSAVDYRVLRSQGLARAGLRTKPLEDIPSLWMPYLRVESPANLSALLARVPALGGQVLVPAMKRPAGGMVAVIADPSGAPVALQTWNENSGVLINE